MGSKTVVLLGLLVAMVLLISSEVAARDLVETANAVESSKQTEATEAEPTQYGGRYRRPYCRYPAPCYGGGGYCRFGCCGRGYYRGRCRCCSYAGQAVDANYEAETHN